MILQLGRIVPYHLGLKMENKDYLQFGRLPAVVNHRALLSRMFTHMLSLREGVRLLPCT